DCQHYYYLSFWAAVLKRPVLNRRSRPFDGLKKTTGLPIRPSDEDRSELEQLNNLRKCDKPFFSRNNDSFSYRNITYSNPSSEILFLRSTLYSQLMKKDVLTKIVNKKISTESGFVFRSLFTSRKLTIPSVKINSLWSDRSKRDGLDRLNRPSV
ncbi:hypothetical protein BpHYR1_033640, partial [Brachionus plicatilis]